MDGPHKVAESEVVRSEAIKDKPSGSEVHLICLRNAASFSIQTVSTQAALVEFVKYEVTRP